MKSESEIRKEIVKKLDELERIRKNAKEFGLNPYADFGLIKEIDTLRWVLDEK